MIVLYAVECSLSTGASCYIEEFPIAASMPPADVCIAFY